MERGERRKPKKRMTRVPRRRSCSFCADKAEVKYRDMDRLERYITDRGKILAKRNSGLCAKHQRQVSRAIKRARHIGLIVYAVD